MFGATKRVELEVIALAQGQERLTCVKEFALELFLLVLLFLRQRGNFLTLFALELAASVTFFVLWHRIFSLLAFFAKHQGCAFRRVIAVGTGDGSAAAQTLVRKMGEHEVVSHVADRRPELLHEFFIQFSVSGDRATLCLGRLARADLNRGRLCLRLDVLCLLEFLHDGRYPIFRNAGEVITIEIRILSGASNIVILIAESEFIVHVRS